jgi:small subunit ribosomal protein S21
VRGPDSGFDAPKRPRLRFSSGFDRFRFVPAWPGPGGIAALVTEIFVGESESIDSALKRFNKRVQAEGVLTDARRHEYYEKPSERRKKKEAARKRKMRKAERRQVQRATRGFGR